MYAHFHYFRILIFVSALLLVVMDFVHVTSAQQANPGLPEIIDPYKSTLERFLNRSNPGKVFFGDDANWSDHKWQVALLHSRIADRLDALYCGGTLIASNWVLTAGHCVKDRVPLDIHVLSGVDDLTAVNQVGKRVNVEAIYLRKDYASAPVPNNDVALLELRADALGTPAVLLTADEEAAKAPSGSPALITGWGLMEKLARAKRLQKGKMPLVSTGVCKDPVIWSDLITDSMICAGGDGASEARGCMGDSGGPLMIGDTLVGVVSWGPSSCEDGLRYTVFARVAKFADDIKSCVDKDVECASHWQISRLK